MRHLTTLLALSVLIACSDEGRGGGGGAGRGDGDAGVQGEDDGAGDDGAGDDGAGDGEECVDTQLYPDEDGDGWGVEEGAETQCVTSREATPGFARDVGDCEPQDPWTSNGTEEICDDHADDNCDPSDDDDGCPESRPAAMDVPDWDCVTGDPPASVRAYAYFPEGGGYFNDGACAIFFEAMPGEFYVRWHGLQATAERAADGACATYEGCICPSDPPFDRRLYAYTLKGSVESCEEVGIRDHAGNDQPVSNACRKYLYALHNEGGLPFYAPDGQDAFDLPFSYVSGDPASFARRLELFPTVEIACAANPPNNFLPFASLLTSPIQVVRRD